MSSDIVNVIEIQIQIQLENLNALPIVRPDFRACFTRTFLKPTQPYLGPTHTIGIKGQGAKGHADSKSNLKY